jgi:hypothetical protein
MVEGTSTVLADQIKLPRKLIALILCASGCACSFVFCFNWGFTYFDVVDHYLAVYLVLTLGIMQSFAIGWVYRQQYALAAGGNASVWVLTFGYWIGLLLIGPIAQFAVPAYQLIAMVCFLPYMVVIAIISFKLSKLSFSKWATEVWNGGVSHLANEISLLSGEGHWWQPAFRGWWCFSIKYFYPFGIYWLLMLSLKTDLTVSYGGYYWGWQALGFLLPIVGLFTFLVPAILCTHKVYATESIVH